MSISMAQYVTNVAHSVLKTVGQTGTLLKQTQTVNPLTGQVTNVEVSYTLQMAFGKIGIKEEYGLDFDFDEKRCYISAVDMQTAGVTPDKDDKIFSDGKNWTVTWVHEYRISDNQVFWMVKVRA